jgi:hypothetical protein
LAAGLPVVSYFLTTGDLKMNVQEVYNKISELKTEVAKINEGVKTLKQPWCGVDINREFCISILEKELAPIEKQLQELYRLEVVQPVVATEATPEDQELTGEALVGKRCEFSSDGMHWVATGICDKHYPDTTPSFHCGETGPQSGRWSYARLAKK